MSDQPVAVVSAAVARQWRDSFFACGVTAKEVEYIAPAILAACFFFDSPAGE